MEIHSSGCCEVIQKSCHLPWKSSSLTVLPKYSLPHMGSRRTNIATGQQASPTVFPEKRAKLKSSKQNNVSVVCADTDKAKVQEHRIDVGDEKSNLLGYEIFSGKLIIDKRPNVSDTQSGTGTPNQDGVDAKLSSKVLVWGSHLLRLEDVISVTYTSGLNYFTVHAYPVIKRPCGLSCFLKPQRARKDFRFVASSLEDAIRWVTGFSDQHCYVNLLPHPMKQGNDVIVTDPFFEHYIKSKTPSKVLVILNPRSGHGRSSKVFHGKVEPILKLAGFQMEIVKTTSAGHAKSLASTVDFSSCPDGIICVGGDGIVNEVLNGLLGRNDQKEAISIPIGIIPAGSDNSLIWTILGVRDPVSAAMTIVKGGLTPTDVFAVEWIQTGVIHFGTTVTYFGFVSDVLELSEKYQKRFGPLRYFVAGFLKFLCLPKYTFELEYLPVSSKETSDSEVRFGGDEEKTDMSDFYTDIMRRSRREGLPRASSLSSIDSIMTPGRMSGGDLETSGSTLASSEPSEYVRCLDSKSKRLSLGRNIVTTEPEEVLHPQLQYSSTPNWPRTRSKSRTDKGWSGLTTINDGRSSWAAAAMNDREDISSTISDPGPVWDPEPKWDVETGWDEENRIHLPGPPDDVDPDIKREIISRHEEKWVAKKGPFLGVLICNHSCRTVQSSQVVAPNAEHDDNTLDLLLVHGSGRLRLARFFLRLQLGQHLSLPYVEYVKVKSVKVKPGKICHNGCGIDGELIPVNGQVICSVLPEQCRLIGHPARGHP